jgi:hypothetical protein
MAAQTGEMMAIDLQAAIEGFSRGQNAYLNGPLQFQPVERSIYRRQTHRLIATAEFDIDILRGHFLPELLEEL